MSCIYVRCADPGLVKGAGYVCERCLGAIYCSRRCQALDWGSCDTGNGDCPHASTTSVVGWGSAGAYNF
ncbi:hypothetical protein B0J17DRAFT_686717 [Rhizoctonia solani]|nr:hypothetical protein B0J17DRAFT_686717 [Rhizoctonia solani]